MIRLNIHEAKRHLSKYLSNLERGETILLCKYNVPIAEIRPVSHRALKKRPIGLDKSLVKVPKKFFEPLPDELLVAFSG